MTVENSTDGNCSSVFIRDSGIGFSYDELKKQFTKEAFEKRTAQLPLSFVEGSLLDEALQEHIHQSLTVSCCVIAEQVWGMEQESDYTWQKKL